MPPCVNLSSEQFKAAEPTLNVVVQANAGTGKTFVLVQRLLRILFREHSARKDKAKEGGATGRPSGILCLTYTNAGAAEMRNRILAAILEWARADDDELRELISGIAHNNPPTGHDIKSAREIFYDFIDNPGTLKIQTIHSFAEDILRRFPIEANVPPAWRLVSGAEQKRLLKDAFQELMNHSPSKEVSDAFDNILGETSEYSLENLLDSILEQYRHILLLKQHPNFPNYIIEKTKNFLNISKAPLKPDFDGKIEDVLTKEGSIRKKLSPELAAVAESVYEYDQYQKNLEIMRISSDFLRISAAFADKYIDIKNRRGLLDFEDMLHKTAVLFSNPKTMGPVLSELDYNLRHILVDESQDNSPIMWDIIFRLLDDFFEGGEPANPRTLFIVGDIKQSIFSFQGATPSEFKSIPDKIGVLAGQKMRQYATVPLIESRRTTRAILDAADFFFNTARPAGFPDKIMHKCWRADEEGLVEIHPLFQKNEDEEIDKTRRRYAKTIADKIESLVRNEKIPESDIMVLVQRREPFASLITRELKRKNIPTAGSDRIVLPKFLTIRDLLNVLRFAIGPDSAKNDAALAFVLRGPLCRWTENELSNLCRGRDSSKPLFEILAEKNPALYKELSEIRDTAHLPPFGFFSKIMNKYRARIIADSGRPAIEPLDEFMTLALSFERTQSGGLAGFLRWFLDGENEIKRDMEKGAGVRILTAHSSKGLEAPVVFLADTTRNPSSPKKPKPFSVLSPEEGAFICKSGDTGSRQYELAKEIDLARQTEEYWRLFYVAMTRARDRLYIYGCEEKSKSESWHSRLVEIMPNMPEAVVSEDNIITISNGTIKPAKKVAKKIEIKPLILPIKSLTERNILKNTEKVSISEVIDGRGHKFAMSRGTDIHKQLQFLDVDDDSELAAEIRKNSALRRFWDPGSRPEVPIAGTIDGEFFSFRIDRMIETDTEVIFLDYKTDASRVRRPEYVLKLQKYGALLSRIYPGKKIRGHILWIRNWELDSIYN